MRYFLLILGLAVVLVIAIAGQRGDMTRRTPIEVFPDMDRQLKLRPSEPNGFFDNGRSSQMHPVGTIARGMEFQTAAGRAWSYEDAPVNTGYVTGTTNFVELNPLVVNAELMKRGQQRYAINCSPCHGQLADGNGITKKYGMAVVANLHDKRIVQMPDGEVFHVISQGRNLMQAYSAQLDVEDRWAVVAYLRALQLARLGSLDDVPEVQRATFSK